MPSENTPGYGVENPKNLSQIAQIAQILLIQGLIDNSTDRGTDIICIEVD